MKLIEVAMPLDEINRESRREKSIRHGHPSTLHLWWARRPLAACRAVLFAQLVDDPSAWPGYFSTRQAQAKERQRLFRLMARLVRWEETRNEQTLQAARQEIARSLAWSRDEEPPHAPEAVTRYLQQHAPHIRDPFCGGGSIPLEAQRLGLPATGSDLNPVAVLIARATCEIPARFHGQPAVSRQLSDELSAETWRQAAGLAEDIMHYGQRMRERAWERIGHLYPKIEITDGMAGSRQDLQPLVGSTLTVIAWIWARTVASPDPAQHGCHVPLVRSFALSTKRGVPAWVEPTIHSDGRGFDFTVRTGDRSKPVAGTVSRQGGRCLLSGVAMPFPYIRAEGQAGRMGSRLMAIVAEGCRGRVFLPPTKAMEDLAASARPSWKPAGDLPAKALGFRVQEYGMLKHSDLFTDRQLVALTTFSDLIGEVRAEVIRDARAAGMSGDNTPLADGGCGAAAYGDAIATYLALAVDKAADFWSSICSWHISKLHLRNTFPRQAIPMIWDYCEANPFSNSMGNWRNFYQSISKVVTNIPLGPEISVKQENASAPQNSSSARKFVYATDPPYFDNIGYADLSDFFYVWLRRTLRSIWPALFATMQVPKGDELIASPHRHGSRDRAQEFFMEHMQAALGNIARQSDLDFPASVFYAYKQAEAAHKGIVSTGWASFLQAAVDAGLAITGTWPMRTEMSNRSVSLGANALASSIALACRRRAADASVVTRGQLLEALRSQLPDAIRILQASDIAPVDLAQAAVGQGMRVFTGYKEVLESDDSRMTVRTALQLINTILDESLETQDVDYDPHTRFALTWFESYSFQEEPYGEAEKLSVAKDVEIAKMDGKLLRARGGKARLLKPDEIAELRADDSIWQCVHCLIWVNRERGEAETARSMALLSARKKEAVKEIAYRLYRICENRRWADLSRDYNSLIASWEGIGSQVRALKTEGEQQELGI